MICNKCKRELPDDSEFCQYCGSKIEKVVVAPVEETIEESNIVETSVAPVSSIVEGEPNIDDMTPDEALNTILKIQAKHTVEAMEANSKTQPDNESDFDFGLVPEKPIYTLALQSVDGELEYLNKLYTVNGQKIKYNRRGSMSVDGINGMIDIYDTFLPSGQPYKTIYVNMYGARKSTKAPNGFVFARSETSTTPKNNVKASRSNVLRENSSSDNLLFFTNISAVVLTIVSMLSIIIAMNVQDVKRNDYENWNPTAVYIILLLILGTFLGFAINSLLKNRFKLISWLSAVPVIAAIIATSEGSITEYGYYKYNYSDWNYYINHDVVDVFNGIWITCVVLVLFITLTPLVVVAIKKMNSHWHKSISYRENCYRRVEKVHVILKKV